MSGETAHVIENITAKAKSAPTERDETSSNETLDAFREISMDLEAVYAEFSKACGLSEPEYWSMVLIGEGCDTQRDISARISCSKQTLNSAFKLLVRKGLIRLIPLEADQRTKQAVLTEEGWAFRHRHIDILYRTEEQAWRWLPPEDQAALTRLTKRFTQALSSELESNASIQSSLRRAAGTNA
jgi:DNA-binding MarR family transcriptional regulator